MKSAQAFSINDRGQVVGISVNGDRQRAFLWSPTAPNSTTGTLVELDNLHGERNQSRASDINTAGQVVGNTGIDAFLWTPSVANGNTGQSVELGDLAGGANVSFATSINAAGQVVGVSNTAVGDRAFLWTPAAPNRSAGSMTDLGSLVTNGTSFAAAINDAGLIAGSSSTPAATEHAVVWANGSITDLGDLPGGNDLSAATDINKAGHVVGHSNSADSEHAFLWTPSDGILDLNTLLDSVSDSKWTLYYAQSINDAGQIVGWGGFDADGAGEEFGPVIHAYLLNPTSSDGDFNADQVVDAADYVVWRTGLGTSYAQNDFSIWREKFGRSDDADKALDSSPAVPEPAGLILVLLSVALCAFASRCKPNSLRRA
jgi:probable HAF family extracellular repeat protein